MGQIFNLNWRKPFINSKLNLLPTAACATKIYTKADGRQACGFFLGRGWSWTDANARCYQLGARLPVITTAQENQDILDVQVPKLTFIPDFINANLYQMSGYTH